MNPSLTRTASLASIPEREAVLKKTVDSILPQVDRLNVYLNNYENLPDFLTANPKIRTARSQEHGDRGDAGKFFWSKSITGYHFTLDDDLLYSDDYIEAMVRKIEQYGRRCAVGLHGGSFVVPTPIRSFFGARRGIHTFATYVEKDVFVNVLGTGVLAYHASTLRVRPEDFEKANMADLWFAVISKKQGIPHVVIQRDRQLAAPLISVQDDRGCLYDRFIANDRFHTEVVNDAGDWPVITLNGAAAIPDPSRSVWTKNPDNRLGHFYSPGREKPRVGFILRCDTGGLANISQEFYSHLAPHKSLVLDLFKEWKIDSFPERFKGKNVTHLDRNPTDSELETWIEGLDAVLTFETPYNWELFSLCRRKNIKSVLMVDYEWLSDPLPSKPDVFWQPANWYLDELKATGVETVFIPMPVNRARYPFKKRTKARTVLCNFGRHNSSTPNRDCKIEIFRAIQMIENSDIRFVIRATQPFIPFPGFPQELIDSVLRDPRVTVDLTVKENPAENYSEGDIYLHPKTYSGMALTMHEALSCGMPVIMVDHFPQNRFLPSEWLVRPTRIGSIKLSRQIDSTRVDSRDVASKIEWMTSGEFDIEKESGRAGKLAESISWEATSPRLEKLFEPKCGV